MTRLPFSRRSCGSFAPFRSSITYLIPLATCAFLVAGCGPGNELGRLPFSGTVTLDGKPVKRGSISFSPTKKGEGAVRGGTTVTDGKFAVEALKGLPPGEYLVRINAASNEKSAPEDQMPGALAPPAKELIPPGWNTQSEHTITIEEGKENHFDFPIKTSG